MTPPHVTLLVARLRTPDPERWRRAAEAWLLPEELETAARLTDPARRAGHVVGRAVMRLAAAALSGREPAALRFDPQSAKPRLLDEPQLGVSVAHTPEVVAVAACRGHQVGVDIEDGDATFERNEPVAKRFFAAAEIERLASLPAAQAAHEFVRLWTAKEAVGKALGVGIPDALRGVVLKAGEQQPGLASVGFGPPAEEWTLHQLATADGPELIAVAVPAPGIPLVVAPAISADQLQTGSLLPGAA